MRRLTRRERQGVAFVAPGAITMASLIVYPLFSVAYLSLVRQDSSGATKFAGLGNFFEVIGSSEFPLVMRNTIIWTISTVLVSFLMGFATALLLNQPFVRGKGVWRSIMLLPWIAPGVVIATTWKWLYSSDFGMWNHILKSIGLIKQPISWLSAPNLVLGAVALVQIWGAFPFVMLMISAGLQSIPIELFESARLDGAHGFQEIRYLILPAISGIVFITLLIELVWALNSFTLIWVMTQGGPASKSRILSLYIYDRFRTFDFNLAAAAAVLQLLVSLIFAITYIYRVNKEEG